MSDEKEAAVRKPYYDRAGTGVRKVMGIPWSVAAAAALDASGVWERIEELEREKDHWQRRYLEAERHRTELVAENARLREERDKLMARLMADAVPAKEFVDRVLAAYAETQENAE